MDSLGPVDVRVRQREIAHRMLNSAAAGVPLRAINDACRAAGLPEIDPADFEALLNGVRIDPAIQAMILREFVAIVSRAPNHRRDRPIGDSLAELGMTISEAEALAQKRVAERMGIRTLTAVR